MRRIGIYSGTFDPVHPGHIAFANAARQSAKLDHVAFLPEPNPRAKPYASPIHTRTAILNAALLQTNHRVHMTKLHQFSVDTLLDELHSVYPGASFHFMFGSDVVTTMNSWPGVHDLLTQYPLIIGMRSKDSYGSVADELDRLAATYTIVETRYAHLSSSQYR